MTSEIIYDEKIDNAAMKAIKKALYVDILIIIFIYCFLTIPISLVWYFLKLPYIYPFFIGLPSFLYLLHSIPIYFRLQKGIQLSSDGIIIKKKIDITIPYNEIKSLDWTKKDYCVINLNNKIENLSYPFVYVSKLRIFNQEKFLQLLSDKITIIK